MLWTLSYVMPTFSDTNFSSVKFGDSFVEIP